MADIRALTRTEGEALVSYLRAMPEEQWDQSTACAPWTVRHLVAHLTAGGHQTFRNFARGIITARFSFDEFVNGDLAKYLGGTPAEVTDRFEASVQNPSTPNKLKEIILGEMIVHGEDIRRAGGDVGAHDLVAVQEIAPMYAKTRAPLNGRRRVEGVTLRATDVDWSFGAGPEVSGPITDLVYATVGRQYALDQLEGEGLDTLRSRM